MLKPDTTIHNAPRESNIELLRILAMFMVLVVHADFYALGTPTYDQLCNRPFNVFARIFFEGWAIGCVNIFVLISGWFGIRPKLKSFSSFLFQCIFFIVGIYLIFSAIGLVDFNLSGVKDSLMLTKWYWFVKAYIFLYILSPVLNSFIEHTEKKQYKIILIAFFTFQSIFGWLYNSTEWFVHGYSTISFIGLYLLAAYVRKYTPKFSTHNKILDVTVIAVMTILFAIISYFSLNLQYPIWDAMLAYTNPIVIIMALFYLLLFSKMRFNNRIVNWFAASSFAVFLFHLNHSITEPFFIPLIRYVYGHTSGILCILAIGITLVGVFILAVLLDQVRIFLWYQIRRILPKHQQID
ncbi:MAG: acyltransferase [Bacteroidales bacterium]|nr:acyltransferase [Bacteroidales bacterium]